MAGVHLVAADRQFGKAEFGIGTRDIPRDIAFCPHALLDPDGLVVPDAREDPRFAASPLVTGPPGIRFYAGMPLISEGLPIGALCVIDTRPRAGITERERFTLKTLASQVSAQIALRRALAQHDALLAERTRSEAHWRGLFEHLREGFIQCEVVRDAGGKVVDWRYIDVNPAWSTVTGVAPALAIGRRVREVFPRIDEALIAEMARVVDTGEPAQFTRQIRRTRMWYEGRAHRVAPDRFAVLVLEITARRRAERYRDALLELGDRLRDMQDGPEMSFVAAEAIGRTLGADRAGYCVMAADNRAAVIERDWTRPGGSSVAGRHDLRDYSAFIDDLARGYTVKVADTRKDERTLAQQAMLEAGGIRAFMSLPLIEQDRLVAFIYVGSAVPRVWAEDELGFVRSVAERTRSAIERRKAESELRQLNGELERRVAERTAELMAAEATLRQAQKMEAVGQLTGGIAHDFNNMLQGIAGGLELMHRRIGQGRTAEAASFVEAAQGMVERASALTHRLLAFARRQALQPKQVDVNALAAGMMEMIERTVGPAVRIDLRLCSEAWAVLCDPNQLENTLLNLVINARDAMPEGGTLSIATRNARLGQAEIGNQDGAAPGDYLEIAISDTGTGMDETTRARAFEPFFTTKPLGQGTGLGLSQLYGFVRQSSGVVQLESRVGHGTTLRFCLPRHLGSAMTEEDGPDPAPAVSASGTVAGGTLLLVDDEAGVRAMAAEHLRELGYEVLEAKDSASALSAIGSRRGARIRVLVTDVGLPNGLNGRQLADAAREHQPGLPVLLITGYAGSSWDGQLEPGMAVMTKPFALDALAARVLEMSAPIE